MYISRFALTNFKSYNAPPAIEFTSGLNMIVGQNNSGKTALLEALKLEDLNWNPHKSPRIMPYEGAPPIHESSRIVSVSISRDELLDGMANVQGIPIFLPYPKNGSDFARSINFVEDSPAGHARLAQSFMSHENYTFQLAEVRTRERGSHWRSAIAPSFGVYEAAEFGPEGSRRRAKYSFDARGKTLEPVGFDNSDTDDDIGVQLLPAFRSRIYVFRAERLNVGEVETVNNPVLSPNASNLPAVLNILHSNKPRFERFNETVHRILPQVGWISVRPSRGGAMRSEIVVWPSPQSEREDLTIPLMDCGTGLGQVLAIVYVVLTTTRPSTIVIDEPQSFLHPGAARKLIEVLRGHPEHQYIIATHSPSIVSAADPQTITATRLSVGETVLEQMNVNETKVQESLLGELGARPSDVFGLDEILWVEGQTEEICYRKIFSALVGEPLMGTQILGVRQTGDLEGEGAERAIEIYNKISSSNSMIPVAVGFLFDSECKSPQRKKELTNKSRNLLRFLPRRMYESYLLHSGAIAAVANATEGFAPEPISEARVELLLECALNDSKYYCDGIVPENHEQKLLGLNAKKVLRSIFSELSEKRVRYDEVVHGTALTDWLIVNAAAELEEIRAILRSILVRSVPAQTVSPSA